MSDIQRGVETWTPYLTEEQTAAINAMASVGDALRQLDPTLLEPVGGADGINLGIELWQDATTKYGTPENPKYFSGTYEQDVFASYHNGGQDGHTSVGALGAGVPRNALIIAHKINEAAGEEIYDPLARGRSFCAAMGHDAIIGCGRSLLPEGQSHPDRGDERLSAEAFSYDDYLVKSIAAGAPLIRKGIIATAYNPNTGQQNVDYAGWTPESDDEPSHEILFQELIAAADLLGGITKRGALNSIEVTVESLFLKQHQRIGQRRLLERGIRPETMSSMLEAIERDKVLPTVFREVMWKQVDFTSNLRYSDSAIKKVCGKGILELFPGGKEITTTTIQKLAGSLACGSSPLEIWHKAREVAGYPAAA